MNPAAVGLSPVYVYFAGYFAAVAASASAARLLPPAAKRPFLAATGLAFAAVFFPLPLVPALAVLGLIVWRLCDGGPELAAGPTAAAGALLAAALLAACFGGLLGHALANHAPLRDRMAAIFALNLLKKAVYYVYERRTGRVRPLGAGQFLAYLFALPFMFHGGVLVSAAHMEERWGLRDFWGDFRAGSATLGLAALHALALWAIVRAAGGWLIGGGFLDRAASLRWWQFAPIFVASYVGYYCLRYSYDQTCVGAARLFGWDIRDNYEWALFAVDYADYWRRWNIHSREMLMSYFYYPTLLSLARRRPGSRTANMTVACFATFAGSGLSDFMIRAIYCDAFAWGVYPGLVARLALYEGFQAAAVSATLALELRRRAAGRPEHGPARRAAGIGATLLLRSLSLPLFLLNDPRAGLTASLTLMARAFGAH